ncbi:coiled-coil domain-containing protein 170-like isoform X2 [Arctopsyche grandis]
MEGDGGALDTTMALRSELAALQYKRDRLATEIGEMKSQVLCRDQRVMELQVEIEHLREQAARQNAIIASLKKKVQDLEDKERSLYSSQGRNEIALQTLQRDNKYHEDRAKDLDKKLRTLELECSNEEQMKDSVRSQLQDLVRRLSVSLGVEFCESAHAHTPESIVMRAAELVQETSRLKSKCINVGESLACVEQEFKNCRDNLERTCTDRDLLQRQCTTQVVELDRLRQEKEGLEMQNRVLDRELHDSRDKYSSSHKSLNSATGNIAQLETTILQLKEDIKMREDKNQRLQHEYRSAMESLAILLSLPTRYIECNENSIKDRVREILSDNKDLSVQVHSLREKLNSESQQLNRHMIANDQASSRLRILEDERSLLETKIHNLDKDLTAAELARDALRRDKTSLITFLERLSKALNMDEISQEVGVDLQTESMLVRAEQLARLESDKIVDKTAVVYQLQRRVRILREQLQRRDLHLDLLRRKLTLQEESSKMKTILQTERDEALLRGKKLGKQADKLNIQLTDARAQIRDLNSQLAEAADYKITALERGRKIEDLQKRLVESEMLRTKYNRKVSVLKDHVRSAGETMDQERSLSDHQITMMREELARTKEMVAEANRREAQLQSFRSSIAKLLGIFSQVPDYEIVSRLQKLVDAHHDFTLVSRRYDDPALRLAARSPTGPGPPSRLTRTPERCLRYDDTGYIDPPDSEDLDDDLLGKRTLGPL